METKKAEVSGEQKKKRNHMLTEEDIKEIQRIGAQIDDINRSIGRLEEELARMPINNKGTYKDRLKAHDLEYAIGSEKMCLENLHLAIIDIVEGMDEDED